MSEPAAFVLVHSPLIGPYSWNPVAERLRQRGHSADVATISGAVEGGPPYYKGFAKAAVESVDVDAPVILVGHSGAGPLLPSIAERLGTRARGAVFVDAGLPHPGRTWFDSAPAEVRDMVATLVTDGRLAPWDQWHPADVIEELLPDSTLRSRFVAELPALPVAYYNERAPTTTGWDAVRCAYIQLSEGYEDHAAEAARRGWPVRRMPADHLAILTRPDGVADAIVEVVTTRGRTVGSALRAAGSARHDCNGVARP